MAELDPQQDEADPQQVELKYVPDLDCFTRFQACIQYWLVPAIWLPLVRWPHFTERRYCHPQPTWGCDWCRPQVELQPTA